MRKQHCVVDIIIIVSLLFLPFPIVFVALFSPGFVWGGLLIMSEDALQQLVRQMFVARVIIICLKAGVVSSVLVENTDKSKICVKYFVHNFYLLTSQLVAARYKLLLCIFCHKLFSAFWNHLGTFFNDKWLFLFSHKMT